MAKVVDQDIPPEMADAYDISLQRATLWKAGGDIYQVRHRVPFRLPHMQDPSTQSPSAAQRVVRNAFKKCVACYNVQPYSGGVTPPDPGPRNRSWWYSAASGSGLWYYDYFIQQSMPSFLGSQVPVWCMVTIDGSQGDTEHKGLGVGVNYFSCDAAWATYMTWYHQQSTSSPTVAQAAQCYGGFLCVGVSPLVVWCGVTHTQRDISFDLSDSNVYNQTGRHIWEIKQCGFLVDVTIDDEPGSPIIERVTGASLTCPSVSGEYLFGDAMSFLGQNPATFHFSGLDWEHDLPQPSCPSGVGQERSRGWIINDTPKIWIM